MVRIVKLFNILIDRSESYQELIPHIINLLKVFKYPFLKEKASDELTYEGVISECLANLGYLFRTPNSAVRAEICACIYNLITFADVPESYANLQRCSKAFILKTIKQSDLPETLVKSLTLMEDDLEIRMKTLKIIEVLSTDEKNCEQMLNAECAGRIVLKMSYPKQNEEYEKQPKICFNTLALSL